MTAKRPVETEAKRGLAQRVRVGAAWGLVNNFVLRLGSLSAGIIMARLLTPTDYGIYAIALVALTILQSMNELGVSLALVRWDGDVRRFAPTVMTIAVVSSVILYAATFVAAPAFCAAMGAPHAMGVLRLLCLSIIIDGVATVPVGILNREFLQRRRFYSDLLNFVTSTSVTIGLAAGGFGAISFAWGRVLGGLVAVVAFILLCPIRVRPGWDKTTAGQLMRFGLPLAGASLLVLATTSVDNLIVGAKLSAAALGFYVMAFNQSSWPLTVFSDAARRVSLAGFARAVQDLDQVNRYLQRGFALLFAASLPVCVLLAVFATPMLHAIYGERWTPAAPALQFLAILGLVRVMTFVGYDLLVAMGRSRCLIALQVLWLVCMVPALAVGISLDGIRGAAIGHAVVAVFVVLPAFAATLHHFGVSIRKLGGAIIRPVLGGLAMIAVSIPVTHLVHGPWAQLFLGGSVAMAVYLPIVMPLRRLLPGRSGQRALATTQGGASA